MKPIVQSPTSAVPTTHGYTRTAVALHWVSALLLVAMTALGWYMTSIEDDPGSAWYFDLHKSLGIVTASVLAVRLAWRAMNRPPGLPDALPRWQARLSGWTHALLYLTMAGIPVTGYLGASYTKAGVQLFGLPTPYWAGPDHDAAEWLFGIHSALVWLLLAVVGVHLMAAVKHLLIDKDGVFQRMWFGSKT